MDSSPDSVALPSSALDCERQNERLRERCEKYKREFVQQEQRIEELENELETSQNQMESLRNKFETARLKAERLDLIDEEHGRLVMENDELRRLLDRLEADLDEKKRLCMQLKLENDEKSKQVLTLSNEKLDFMAKCDQTCIELNDERQFHEYTKKKKEEAELRLEHFEPVWRRRLDELSNDYSYRLHNEHVRMQKMENDCKKKLQLAEEVQKHYQEQLAEVDALLRQKNEEICAQRDALLQLQAQLRSVSAAEDDSGHSRTPSSGGSVEDAALAVGKTLSLDHTFSSGNSSEKATNVYVINSRDNCGDRSYNTSTLENTEGGAELRYTPPPPYDDDDNFLRCMKFQWKHELQPTASLHRSTMTAVEMKAVSPVKTTMSANSISFITSSDSTQSITTSLVPTRHFCHNMFASPYFTRSSVFVLLLMSAAAFWTLRSHISYTLPFYS